MRITTVSGLEFNKAKVDGGVEKFLIRNSHNDGDSLQPVKNFEMSGAHRRTKRSSAQVPLSAVAIWRS